ncbi:helix-turn-helix domain-containing protein [Nocardia sp. SYP-A9097]|uniref:AraC family transcriptional regulator n=1 Tax=Nocardia sp. SYP-A9097 TaxID=2663237 RepID=UPI00129A264F|nr:helix-turn-helix domain-containing protein [Nocardia sp. SYP-A9097]MRH89657.1 helix-turn-helix domain-containing protein [Nocardia sp. SYP-A9097]
MITTRDRPGLMTAEDFEDPVAPPESLRPWFTEIGRIPAFFDLSPKFAHVPQAATTIVLRGDASDHRDVLVVGPHTRAVYAAAKQPVGCLRLRLAPGAVQPLLGLPAADLADKVVLISDVPGVAADFAAELTELNLDEVLPFLGSVLPQHIPTSDIHQAHRRLLESAVHALSTAPGSITDLAAALSVSERHLRNLFSAGIGVSPKHFARITRIRQVLAAAGNTPWSDLAHTASFYDQSHMVADFRSLMGVTPDRFFRGIVPAPSPCRSITMLSK